MVFNKQIFFVFFSQGSPTKLGREGHKFVKFSLVIKFFVIKFYFLCFLLRGEGGGFQVSKGGREGGRTNERPGTDNVI